MCLGVPGKIVEIWDEPSGARMANVEFPDEVKKLCLAYRPDMRIGEYTIAHAGVALLTRIEEASAMAAVTEYGVFGEDEVVPS